MLEHEAFPQWLAWAQYVARLIFSTWHQAPFERWLASPNAPGWAQAIFSVLAIVGSAWGVQRAHALEVRQRRREVIEKQIALLEPIYELLLSAQRSLTDGLSNCSARRWVQNFADATVIRRFEIAERIDLGNIVLMQTLLSARESYESIAARLQSVSAITDAQNMEMGQRGNGLQSIERQINRFKLTEVATFEAELSRGRLALNRL
jgi:hypothetical protein